MEGVGGELIKTLNELKGELAKAYKIIAEKEAEVKRMLEGKEVELQRLRKENAVLRKHLQSEGKDGRDNLEIVERKAEEIIPKECWAAVFRNLDVEDLLRCLQVCKAFHQLLDLHEFKMKWKFKLVLPLLFPYLKTSDLDRKPWKHLYNPRLVCRSWRHSIDKYTSEEYGKQNFSPKHLPLLTSFETSEHIQEFLEKFGECTTNPFPSRSVEIRNPENLEEEDGVDWVDAMQQLHDTYFGNVGQLLEQFGKHIFRLRLNFEYDWPDPYPVTLCRLIKSFTIHLPSLKELDIHCLGAEDVEDNEEYVKMAAAYIAENPIEASALPKLRVLSISGFGFDMDKKMEDYLLDPFRPQLTHLQTHFYKTRQMKKLKKLRKLLLDVRGRNINRALKSLRFLQSPLELLKLNCFFWTAPQTWSMDKVLRKLKHLPIELLEIHLSFWVGAQGRANLAEAGLDIEKYKNASIKTLILHITIRSSDVEGRISFNFLPALTKLENLKLKFYIPRFPRITHPEELAEVVKLNEHLFGEGANRAYQSNVWEKVPSLKTLTSSVNHPWTLEEPEFVERTIFTREEYERIRTVAEVGVPERN